MKLRPILAVATALTFLPATASAFEYVTVGIGGMFQAGGNFLDKPDDQTIQLANGKTAADPEYPGFAGLTLGGGGFVDVRFIKYVGIEFGVLYTSDKGEAELKITNAGNEAKFDITISHNAIHMPLLVKGVIPGAVAQPMLFVGPEFVVPLGDGGDAECEQTSPPAANCNSLGTKYMMLDTPTYIMVTFGLGVEFKLPLPVVDIRIPLTLRGSIDPGVPETRQHTDTQDGRAKYTINGNAIEKVEYKTEWKFQAAATLGTSIHF